MKRLRSIIYLACPYTDRSFDIRERRYIAATLAAAKLIGQGHIVFSPITMTHPIDALLAGQNNTLGSDFWVNFDEAFMECCSEMVILKVDGWESSLGIEREKRFFESKGLPIRFLDPSG